MPTGPGLRILSVLVVAFCSSSADAGKKWLCNYAGTLHDTPEDCTDPSKGGKWIDDGTVDAEAIATEFWAADEETRGKVLAYAAEDAMRKFAEAGIKYGPKPSESQFNCSIFTTIMVAAAGVDVTDRMSKSINMPTVDPAKDVDLNRDNIRGVQKALMDAGVGGPIAADQVQVGDLIQIWNKSGGSWIGHSGVITSVRSSDEGKVYARVTSPSRSASAANGGVVASSSDEWDMSKAGSSGRKYYPVRLTSRR